MPTDILPIDATWPTMPVDPHPEADFRPQDVELLLDQAADLLDRILRDKSEYDALGEKLFEAEQLDTEHQRYNENRDVTLPNGEIRSIPAKSLLAKACNEEYAGLTGELTNMEAQLGYYTNASTQLTQNTQDQGNVAGATVVGAFPQTDAVRRVRIFDLVIQSMIGEADRESAAGSLLNSRFQAGAIAMRAISEDFKANLQNDLRAEKLGASGTLGSPLNFLERRKAIKARVDNDFMEARRRVAVAVEGLKKYYNYQDPLQEDPGELGVYSNYLIWVRKAISFLVGLTRKDQQFVIPVSLKNLMKEGWSGSLGSRSWAFKLQRQNVGFADYYKLVRLRGVALSILTKGLDASLSDVWSGELEVAGDTVARCHIGRIRPCNPLREADLVGEVLLHNIDPFTSGDNPTSWTISIPSPSLRGTILDKDSVEDVWLELHVVAH